MTVLDSIFDGRSDLGSLSLANGSVTGPSVSIAIVDVRIRKFGLDLQAELATHKHPKIAAERDRSAHRSRYPRAASNGELKNEGQSMATSGSRPPASGHVGNTTFDWKPKLEELRQHAE